MLNLNERFVVDAAGHPVEVVLPIESDRRLPAWLAQTAPAATGEEAAVGVARGVPPGAGTRRLYLPRKIVELTRQIKREVARA